MKGKLTVEAEYTHTNMSTPEQKSLNICLKSHRTGNKLVDHALESTRGLIEKMPCTYKTFMTISVVKSITSD